MLAIIPARAGSKGLPEKNTKLFNGIPLILHTLKAAKRAKTISRIIISSNDEKVISVCKGIKGVDIPFKRPEYLSKDNSNVIDTFFHLFAWLKKNEKIEPKEFCVLQPTSPLRIPADIDGAINLFKKKKADVVLSVYETKPVLWHFKLSNKNKMQAIEKSNRRMIPRQKLNNMVLQNGSVHVFKLSVLRKNKSYHQIISLNKY